MKKYQNCCEEALDFCTECPFSEERWPEPVMKVTNCFALGNRRIECHFFLQDQWDPLCPTGDRCRLPGLQVQLQSGMTLPDRTPVLFDAVVNKKSTILRYVSGSGNFIITQPGNYYVTWSVNLNQGSAGKVRLGLTLNGTPVANTDVWAGREQVTGAALVTVSSSPTTLQLANLTGSNLTYDTVTTIRANLVILQVD